MPRLRYLIAPLLLFVVLVVAVPVAASETVFVNLTSSEPERVGMGLGFAHALQKDGHAVTIFLNLDGGMVGSTKTTTLAEQRKTLEAFMKDGGKVLICPHCMQLRKIVEADLVKGIALSASGAARTAFLGATRSISY